MANTTEDKLNLLKQSKTDMFNAIKNKLEPQGESIPENTPLSDYDIFIKKIKSTLDTSDATATVDDIVYDKTAYVDGNKLTGAIQNGKQYFAPFGFNPNPIINTEYVDSENNPIVTLTSNPNTDDSWVVNRSTQLVMSVKQSSLASALNLTSNKLKQGETILGVTGSVVQLIGTTATINPSTQQQILTPESPNNGFTEITVNPVTSAIDANIVTGNIKAGTTILGVSGSATVVDTSDATATANDIVNPETAYVDGVKITGAIVPSYGVTALSKTNTVLTPNVSVGSNVPNVFYHDIRYDLGLAVRMDASNIYIYRLANNIFSTLLTVSLNTLNFADRLEGIIKFVPTIATDNKILLVAITENCVTASGFEQATTSHSGYLLEYDITNNTLRVLSSRPTYQSYTHSGTNPSTSYTKFQGALTFTSPSQVLYARTESFGIGYRDVPWYLRYNYLSIDLTNKVLSVGTVGTANIMTVGRGSNWDGGPTTSNYYLSGDYLVMQVRKNYRGNTVNQFWYVTLFFNYKTSTLYYKSNNSDIGYALYNGKVFGDNKIYSSPSSSSYTTISLSFPNTRRHWVIGDNLIYSNSSNTYVYKLTTASATQVNTASGVTNNEYDLYNQTVFGTNTSYMYLYESTKTLLGLTRNNVEYVNTENSNASSEDLLETKTAFVDGNKITGTMANNGTRYVTPSASTQILPSGYYSTLRVYGDSDLVSSNIKNGVNIFGVIGTYQGTDTSDATAVATDIKSGQTAYVNGTKVIGTLPEVINPASISSTEIYNGSFFKPDDGVGTGTLYGNYLVTDDQGSHVGTEYLVNWVKVTNLQTWYIQNQQKVKVGMPVSNIATTVGLTPNKLKKDEVVLGVTGTYEGSSSAIEEKDVNFYDYDGVLLYSYSASDFVNLTALPSNPSHTGLTAQGWNWTLSDAKTYVSTYGKLNIGQMYVTSDGKTRIYITLTEGRLEPYLGFMARGTISVDWRRWKYSGYSKYNKQ